MPISINFTLIFLVALIVISHSQPLTCEAEEGVGVCESTCQCHNGGAVLNCQRVDTNCVCPCEPPTPEPAPPTPVPCRCIPKRDDIACMMCRLSSEVTAEVVLTEEAHPSNCMACGPRTTEPCLPQPLVRKDCESQPYSQKQCSAPNGVAQCHMVTTFTITQEAECGGEECPGATKTLLNLSQCCPPTPFPTPSLCCSGSTARATTGPTAPKVTTTTTRPTVRVMPTPTNRLIVSPTPIFPRTNSTAPTGTRDVICAQLGCERCMMSDCKWCATSEFCLDPFAIQFDLNPCARYGNVCPTVLSAQVLAIAVGRSSKILVGNTTVSVTPDPGASSPTGDSVTVSPGKPFRLTFVPAVAVSHIELDDFLEEDQGRLTATLIESGFSANTKISDSLIEVFALTKAGFNVYEIAALGSASFRVARIVIEPAHPKEAVSSTTTSVTITSDSSDSLPIGAEGGNGALDDLTIGLIAGGVALVVLIVLILVVWLIKRPRHQREEISNSHAFGASARDDGDVFFNQTPLNAMSARSHEYGSIGMGSQSPKRTVSHYDAVTSPLD